RDPQAPSLLFKELFAQNLLKLANGLGDGRLADGQHLGGPANRFLSGDLDKRPEMTKSDATFGHRAISIIWRLSIRPKISFYKTKAAIQCIHRGAIMQSAQIGDIAIHYRYAPAQGDAPIVVFINSLGTDFRIWDDVL